MTILCISRPNFFGLPAVFPWPASITTIFSSGTAGTAMLSTLPIPLAIQETTIIIISDRKSSHLFCIQKPRTHQSLQCMRGKPNHSICSLITSHIPAFARLRLHAATPARSFSRIRSTLRPMDVSSSSHIRYLQPFAVYSP